MAGRKPWDFAGCGGAGHSRLSPSIPSPTSTPWPAMRPTGGGYLVTEEPDCPVMVLTAPLPKNDRDGTRAWRHLPVSVPPEMLQAGQFYLIGGPGQESYEVVRVEAEVVPGQPRIIRRRLFRTLGTVTYPAGTWVRPGDRGTRLRLGTMGSRAARGAVRSRTAGYGRDGDPAARPPGSSMRTQQPGSRLPWRWSRRHDARPVARRAGGPIAPCTRDATSTPR